MEPTAQSEHEPHTPSSLDFAAMQHIANQIDQAAGKSAMHATPSLEETSPFQGDTEFSFERNDDNQIVMKARDVREDGTVVTTEEIISGKNGFVQHTINDIKGRKNTFHLKKISEQTGHGIAADTGPGGGVIFDIDRLPCHNTHNRKRCVTGNAFTAVSLDGKPQVPNVIGGPHNDTVIGSAGPNKFKLNEGENFVLLGAYPGLDSDEVFVSPGATNIIDDFEGGKDGDTLVFEKGISVKSFAEIQALMQSAGGGEHCFIEVNGEFKIILLNTPCSSLTADNFKFEGGTTAATTSATSENTPPAVVVDQHSRARRNDIIKRVDSTASVNTEASENSKTSDIEQSAAPATPAATVSRPRHRRARLADAD